MGKKRKGTQRTVAVYDSDDERKYASEKVPNKNDADFYEDEIDQFHKERDKILLSKGAKIQDDLPSSGEDEVLAFDDDDSDSDDEVIAKCEAQMSKIKSAGFKDELKSDVEDESDDEEEEKTWGGKKSLYYGDDMDDYDAVESGGSDTEAAVLEEQEALEIQKKMMDQLADEDFDLDQFKPTKKSKDAKDDGSTAEKVIIPKDLSKLSRREKMLLLEKDSPELQELVNDYKLQMGDLQKKWLPIFQLIKAGKLPDSNAVKYVQIKVKLALNYCTNLHFYLLLKAKRTPIVHHPVIARIVQYRKLLNELSSADDRMEPEIAILLEIIEKGDGLSFETSPKPIKSALRSSSSKTMQTKRKKIKSKKGAVTTQSKKKLSQLVQDSEEEEEEEEAEGNPEGGRSWGRKRKAEEEDGVEETQDEKEALKCYQMMKKKKGGEPEDEDEDEEANGEEGVERVEGEEEEEEGGEAGEWDEEGGKRGITYQIEKNKGLTPKRKKEQRNPRVKHRMKYRKANIRRKGQVREVRTEMHRYGGEISGIRAGIKRSIKLK